MIESARDPNSPKVITNSLSHPLKDFYLFFFYLLKCFISLHSFLSAVTVCPPGVSRERHSEPGFTPEGLCVQKLQTHARSAIPLPRRLQT